MYSACQTHLESALREGAEPYLKIESMDRKGDGGSGGELKSDMHRWGGGGGGRFLPLQGVQHW